MNFQLKLQNEELETLKGMLAYTNEALSQSDIKEWERQEFEAVKLMNLKDIKETEELIERIKNL